MCIGAVSLCNNFGMLRSSPRHSLEVIATNDHGQVWWHHADRDDVGLGVGLESHVNLHVRITACASDEDAARVYIATKDNRIVVVAGRKVQAEFGTNLADPITMMRVYRERIYAAADTAYAVFTVAGEEVEYRMVSSPVLALDIVNVAELHPGEQKHREDEVIPILATADCLRTFVDGHETRIKYDSEVAISCITSCMKQAEDPTNVLQPGLGRMQVYLGGEDGHVVAGSIIRNEGGELEFEVSATIQGWCGVSHIL